VLFPRWRLLIVEPDFGATVVLMERSDRIAYSRVEWPFPLYYAFGFPGGGRWFADSQRTLSLAASDWFPESLGRPSW